jgi:hypothetical protein
MKIKILTLVVIFTYQVLSFAEQIGMVTAKSCYGNKFVFAQLKYGKDDSWDVYPDVWREILNFLTLTTSIKVAEERKIVTLQDTDLFLYPFITIIGNNNTLELTKSEIGALQRYLLAGGIVFINDASDRKNSSFDYSVRKLFSSIFPNNNFSILPQEHVIFRSFYLHPKPVGKRLINNYIEGINISNRTVVIYSQNDLLGCWVKNIRGDYLYPCIPDGETQRIEAIKLTTNIILYALTGTYKLDVVHKSFIEQKLNLKRRQKD